MECFKVYANQIENRIDPLYYSKELFSFLDYLPFENSEIEKVTEYIKTGFAAGHNLQDKTEKGIIQIRPTNIGNDRLLKFDKSIYVKKEYLTNEDILLGKEILFNNTNSQELVGKSAYFDIKGTYVCSNHITRIKVNEKIIMPQYLWIILNIYQSKKIFYVLCTNWNNQSGVNVELLRKIKIPIPPIETQNKIVEIMDSAYNTKKQKEEEAQKLIDSIDEYILSELGIAVPKIQTKMCFRLTANEITGILSPLYYISETFKSQDYLLLKDLSNINPSRKSKVTQLEDFVPYVGLPETEVPRIKEVLLRPYREVKGRKIIRKGDILFARIEPSVFNKKYIFVDNLFGHDYAFTSTEFIIVEPKQKINPLYLYYILFSDIGYNQVIGKTTGSTGRRRLDSNVFKNLVVPCPPIEIQNKIADEVKSRMNKADQLVTESKTILDEARKEVERIILSCDLCC